MSGKDHGFSANKIFVILFVLTALEVVWGVAFHSMPRWALWGGLLVFAFWKGFFIFTYFMHMKFEGWVVKALIAPTPLLAAIAVFAVMPDVSLNEQLVHPVGSQYDPSVGEVLPMEQTAISKSSEVSQH
jgi:cytochrome c oxidase subunit IV